MMDIEEILKKSADESKIPQKVEYRVQHILKNKDKKIGGIYYMKKLITIFTSIMIVMIGSVSVYAAMGGEIAGKPVLEWLGIKFSDEYDNYKVAVGEEIISNETTINLVSALCDEGFTTLEFDVKLSKEDKEYLKLGEKVITQADYESARRSFENNTQQQQVETFEESYEYQRLETEKDLINTLAMKFNTDVDDWDNNYLIIDGEGHWVKSYQTTMKISDYEYKIYQLYLLTDKQLGDKTDFTLTLKSNQLKNKVDNSNDTKDTRSFLVNTQNNERTINIDGEFNVNVSKKRTLDNSKIIDNINQEVNYKKMTEKIEKVTITPMQIVAKVVVTIDDVSSNSLQNTRHRDYIGLLEFKTYDEDGNEIDNLSTETKRLVTYKNGESEEWATGDIDLMKTFSNGKMELTYYIIIEKKNGMKGLTIVPTVKEVGEQYEEIIIELDGKFNIDIE